MIGLFIMDVSGSTAQGNTDEVRHKLQQLEKAINQWTQSLNRRYVNFRMGDELFFVCDSPGDMLIIAYYIKLSWPLKSQTLKFGLSIGESELPEANFEHWNAPIIKKARQALENIKTNDQVDLYLSAENVSMINHVLFYYMTDILHHHTDIQREILLMSLAIPIQRELAHEMGKSFSTVSTHLKKARSKQLDLIEQELIQYSSGINEAVRKDIRQTLKDLYQ